MGTSINRIKFKYSQSPGLVGLMEVEYNFDGKNYVRRYCDGYNGHQEKEVSFILFLMSSMYPIINENQFF